MIVTEKRAENPVREMHGKLTERMPHQSQDHHDIRAGGVASSAYAEGWERLWGAKKRKERSHG